MLSYLRSEEDFDYQVSTFTKYSVLHFFPDINEDIAFNGIAQNALRQDFSNGIQAEGTYRLGAGHTLRGGVILNEERTSSDTANYVLPIDASGIPTSSAPLTILNNSEKSGWTYSAFAQDEWKILPTVTINYGGRFDVVNTSTMENQISPRINAVWQATPSTTVHGGYANYFTPPPFELFSSSGLIKFAGTSADCSQNGPGSAEWGLARIRRSRPSGTNISTAASRKTSCPVSRSAWTSTINTAESDRRRAVRGSGRPDGIQLPCCLQQGRGTHHLL